MSASLSAPPLSASGGDPLVTPPPPPPLDASNHPSDRQAGVVGEMSAAEQAAARQAPTPAPKVSEPEAPVTTTETPEPAADAVPPVDAKPDTTPPAIKAEITRERNRRREAETAREAAEKAKEAADQRLTEALERLKELTPKPPPEPVAEPRPRRDAFESPEAYDAAVDDWAARAAEHSATEARKAAEQDIADRQRRDAEAAAEAARKADTDALALTWSERRAKAISEMPDYEAVVETDALSISAPMAEAIMRSDNGPAVAYHLGKNPQEAARIASLPNVGAQLFEMGRLSATLAKPAPVAVSRTPAPITPLSTARESATDTDREESMEEVAARVTRDAASRRRSTFGAH